MKLVRFKEGAFIVGNLYAVWRPNKRTYWGIYEIASGKLLNGNLRSVPEVFKALASIEAVRADDIRREKAASAN